MIDLRLRINDFGFGEKKNDSKLIYFLKRIDSKKISKIIIR